MLKIRNEQMSRFKDVQADQFENRLVNYLIEEFPEARHEPREELKSAVNNLVKKACLYDLVTEQQIAIYVTCAWFLGLDFDKEFPAAQQVLSSAAYRPDEKAEWLVEWTDQLFAALEE